MKKLAIVAIIAIITAGSAFAATTANTDVTATITQNISVTAPATATITLAANGAYNLGDATFYSNRKGWKIGATSTNGGDLVGAKVGSTDAPAIPYSFKIAAAGSITEFNVASGALPTTASGNPTYHNVAARTAATGDVAVVSITVGAEDLATWFSDFTYTDTITLTIAAN